jgi:hypothetical protein
MKHTIQYITRSEYDRTARCICGWTPDPRKVYRTRDMVVDEVRKHETLVQRARVAAQRGGGSLTSDLRYFTEMADNPNVDPSDRALWKQLADETRARLGTKPTDDEQPQLFLMKE